MMAEVPRWLGTGSTRPNPIPYTHASQTQAIIESAIPQHLDSKASRAPLSTPQMDMCKRPCRRLQILDEMPTTLPKHTYVSATESDARSLQLQGNGHSQRPQMQPHEAPLPLMACQMLAVGEILTDPAIHFQISMHMACPLSRE